MLVEVEWKDIGPNNPWANWRRCLYAYVKPMDRQIVYVGKADGATVRERFQAADKSVLFDFMHGEMGLSKLGVLVGNIILDSYLRLSRELLADIESLLIKRIVPVGNVSSIHSRISRPGMEVVCTGDWPHHKARLGILGR